MSKSFGRRAAVRDLTLVVPEQSICGFIGPNGSGKTTTLRMIMGIYYPDPGSGPIRVLGQDVSGSTSDRVGYLPEERGLHKRMRVGDLLRFYAELKGCSDVRRTVGEWLDRLGLAAAIDQRIDTLSKGMAQKIQFIAAVIHRPPLIILDEPFSGLDPVNTDVIREVVLDLRRQGTTVMFSTHDMPVAEKMCDFIVMMHEGRKVLDGPLRAIQQTYGVDTIRVRTAGGDVDWRRLPGVRRVSDFGRYTELQMVRDYQARTVLAELAGRTEVLHFEVTQPSLHDIFVRIAGRDGAEMDHA